MLRPIVIELRRGLVKAIPAVIVLLSLFVDQAPINLGFDVPFSPELGVSVLFFFILMRPDCLPSFVVLALGIIADVLCVSTMGLHGMLWLALYIFLARQRVHIASRSPNYAFVIYVCVMSLNFIVKAAFNFIFFQQDVLILNLAMSIFLTMALYPFFVVCFMRLGTWLYLSERYS